MIVSDLIQRHVSHLAARESRSVMVRQRFYVRDIEPPFRAWPVDHVRAVHAQACFELWCERGATTTAHTKLSYAKALWAYALRCGFADHNPWSMVDTSQHPKARKHPGRKSEEVYSLVELRALLTAPHLPTERRALWMALALMGLRIGEALALSRGDVVRKARGHQKLVVGASLGEESKEIHATKTGVVREIPLPLSLAAVLDDLHQEAAELEGRYLCPEDPLLPRLSQGLMERWRTQKTITRWLRRDLGRASVDVAPAGEGLRRSCHTFRHTFCTQTKRLGIRPEVVDLMTHPPKTEGGHRAYAHVLWEDRCAAIERFEHAVLGEPRDPDELEEDFVAGVIGQDPMLTDFDRLRVEWG